MLTHGPFHPGIYYQEYIILLILSVHNIHALEPILSLCTCIRTAPPGPPRTLTIDSSNATSFVLCWEAPLEADSPISFYTVSTRNLNSTGGTDGIVTRNTTTNSTLFTLTGLLPGTAYEVTVMAVSQGGDVFAVGEPGEPMTGNTDVTGKVLMILPLYMMHTVYLCMHM